jgi:hypothetical protein
MDPPLGPRNIAPNAPPPENPFSSAVEEETDAGVLSGGNELEPQPGLGGNPVRCEFNFHSYSSKVLNINLVMAIRV